MKMLNLTTKRLVLSPLCEADFEQLIPLYTNADARRYLGGALSYKNALVALDILLKDIASHSFVVRTHDEIVGMTIVAPHHNQVDTEISFLFLPTHWGNGYAQESIKCILAFCETKLKLKRVVSETQVANICSVKLLETLGYKLECTLERFGEMQGVYVYDFECE